MPRRRSTNKPRKGARRENNDRAIRRFINGHPKRVPSDPTTFTQIPWNTCIVQYTVNGVQEVKVSGQDAIRLMITQIGLPMKPDPPPISGRIMEVSAWELAGGSITLSVQDLTIGFSSADYIFQSEDLPGRNHWAKVGYVYPASQNKIIFNLTDEETLFILESSNKTDAKVTVRMRILWKPRVTDVPTSLNAGARIRVLEREVKALTDKLSKIEILPD